MSDGEHPYPLTDIQKAEFDRKLWAWQVEDAEGHPLTMGQLRQRLDDAITGYVAMSASHDLMKERLAKANAETSTLRTELTYSRGLTLRLEQAILKHLNGQNAAADFKAILADAEAHRDGAEPERS